MISEEESIEEDIDDKQVDIINDEEKVGQKINNAFIREIISKSYKSNSNPDQSYATAVAFEGPDINHQEYLSIIHDSFDPQCASYFFVIRKSFIDGTNSKIQRYFRSFKQRINSIFNSICCNY